MSIRPINLDELPETSFEDMDTTFTRDHEKKTVPDSRRSPLSRQPLVAPTPTSSTSSGGTIFSHPKEKLSRGSKTEEDEEEVEEEDEFLNDFQEFQDRKDDFDDALKTYFKLRGSSASLALKPDVSRPDSNELAREFSKRLNIGSKKRPPALRQPRSMMELKTRPRSNGEMPNSLSTGDLRVQSNSTVRFKKSMPTLSNFNPTIEEEEEDFALPNQVGKYGNRFRNDLMETNREEDEDDDKDFVFDERLIQPQFLNRPSEESPLKLSPSQYEIVRDDALLTPRLHKRYRDWNAKNHLDSFKEQVPALSRRRSARNTTAASRIKTIKQEIDHNTPIKNGRMYYNPKTMKWEGNEQVLDKFTNLDAIDKKPLLIKSKSQLNETTTQEPGLTKPSMIKPTKRLKKPRIIGKMMFDDENLRWVSVHGDDEEQDPFAGIKDIEPVISNSPKTKHYISPFLRSQSQLLPSTGDNIVDRLNSSATTRYHSMGVTNREIAREPAFQLSSRLLEKFCHEENRWNRKVGGWFLLGNKDSESESRNKNEKCQSHMFEIRNMVMNSTRG